jgi:hypothetical protein
VVFSIVGLGVRGTPWAVGVSAGVAGLAILMFFYGLLFGLVWLVLKLPSLGLEREPTSGPPVMATVVQEIKGTRSESKT